MSCPGSHCRAGVSLVLTSMPGCSCEWNIKEFGLAVKDLDFRVTWGKQFRTRICVMVDLEPEMQAGDFPEKEFILFLDQSLFFSPEGFQSLGLRYGRCDQGRATGGCLLFAGQSQA